MSAIDPSNRFAVSIDGHGCLWLHLCPRPHEPLSRDDALNLAAWLAALADPGGEEFARVLRAMRES